MVQCPYLLIDKQTAELTHKQEAKVKPRNLDDFLWWAVEFTKLSRGNWKTVGPTDELEWVLGSVVEAVTYTPGYLDSLKLAGLSGNDGREDLWTTSDKGDAVTARHRWTSDWQTFHRGWPPWTLRLQTWLPWWPRCTKATNIFCA